MTVQTDPLSLRKAAIALIDADNSAAVKRIFFKTAKAYGLSHATIMVMPARTDKSVSCLVLDTNHADDFFTRFDELGGAEGCLLFEMLRSGITPISWTIEDMEQRYRNLGRDVPAVYQLYVEQDLTAGMAMPLTTVDGSRHAIMLAGPREKLQDDEVCELTLQLLRIFEAYDRVRSGSKVQASTLTAREMEVVRWTAAGKTSSEIGRIMDLSDHTINAYLNNAFKKLDCVSRTQLVAKALRLRVIS